MLGVTGAFSFAENAIGASVIAQSFAGQHHDNSRCEMLDVAMRNQNKVEYVTEFVSICIENGLKITEYRYL